MQGRGVGGAKYTIELRESRPRVPNGRLWVAPHEGIYPTLLSVSEGLA